MKYGVVLKRIPKGSRQKAAKVLTQILENLVRKRTVHHGKDFSSLADPVWVELTEAENTTNLRPL